MEFAIIAHDGKDEGAPARRLAARPAHFDNVKKFIADGILLYAAALLDEAGNMNGSLMVCNFPSRAALDDWLKVEPYVVNKVWQKIEVQACKPPFATKIMI